MSDKLKAVSFQSVGGAYHNGRYHPSFGQVKLSDGSTIYVPSLVVDRGLQAIVNYAKGKGVDVADMQAKLDNWVETGQGLTFGLLYKGDTVNA